MKGDIDIKKYRRQKGQALITLLFFMVIGVAIITTSITILFANMKSTTTSEVSQMAYYFAESGIDDAMLQVLRDPKKLTNPPITYNPVSGSTQISVNINGNIITATGTYGNAVRKIQVQTTYTNGILTFTNWKEIN